MGYLLPRAKRACALLDPDLWAMSRDLMAVVVVTFASVQLCTWMYGRSCRGCCHVVVSLVRRFVSFHGSPDVLALSVDLAADPWILWTDHGPSLHWTGKTGSSWTSFSGEKGRRGALASSMPPVPNQPDQGVQSQKSLCLASRLCPGSNRRRGAVGWS